MKIGIIREGKVPPDSRVPLIPAQCKHLIKNKGLDLVVQTSPNRCFSDAEYQEAGVRIVDTVADCDILLGVKEVPIEQLIPDKTYFFFSHTYKKQPYNRPLLQAILKKNIELVDYELLTNSAGQRVIAFGHFAGMVGAYNGLLTYGRRTGTFSLQRMYKCHDYAEAKQQFAELNLPALKIVVTGGGRVANGSVQVLQDMGIRSVAPSDFISKAYNQAVFTQLDCADYAEHKAGKPFELTHFFEHPQEYRSKFAPYTQVADIFINGIYWDSRAPQFFTLADLAKPSFNLQVIADVTCDIAPVASIPTTIRASTIADPIFGIDKKTHTETAPHLLGSVDIMTIDNLPNEMPRDASTAFGQQFIEAVLPDLIGAANTGVIQRGTMTHNGALTERYAYLEDWVKDEQ